MRCDALKQNFEVMNTNKDLDQNRVVPLPFIVFSARLLVRKKVLFNIVVNWQGILYYSLM